MLLPTLQWVKASCFPKTKAFGPLTHTVCMFSFQRVLARLSFLPICHVSFKFVFLYITNFSVKLSVMLLLCRRFSESSDKGWFRSLFVHKVDARKDAHSNLLSKKETSNLYKIQCRHWNLLFTHERRAPFCRLGVSEGPL